jgi:tRNA threonylcarbamoyladenosine biosynthesis protein TsaE
VRLSGPLGAGKTAFARGFIRKWASLAGDPVPESIASPSYNIVKVYGEKAPLAHFDLYRLRSMSELEAIGFEQYFFETPCCLVEWLERVPEAAALMPAHAVTVELAPGPKESERVLRIRDPGTSS